MNKHIEFHCTDCLKEFRLPLSFANKWAKCKCGHKLKIPSATNLEVKVINVEHGEIDSDDGSTSITSKFQVTNNTEHEIERVYYTITVRNPNGYIVASERSETDEAIEPGETEVLDAYGLWIQHRLLRDASQSKIEMRVSGCSVSHANIGSVNVPTATFDVGGKKLDKKLGKIEIKDVSIWLERPDEDGDQQLKILINQTNTDDEDFPCVNYDAKLKTESGREIEEICDMEPLHSFASECREMSFWGLKSKKLKGTCVELSATSYSVIGTGFAEHAGITQEVNTWDNEEDDDDFDQEESGFESDPQGVDLDTESIESKVTEIISEVLGVDPEEVQAETSLKDDLSLEELDRVELVLELEEEFDISISDEEGEQFETVSDISNLIMARTEASDSSGNGQRDEAPPKQTKIEGVFDPNGWMLPTEGHIEWSDLITAAGPAKEASLVSDADWNQAISENRVLTIEHAADGMQYIGRSGRAKATNLCRVVLSRSIPDSITVDNVDITDIDCSFFEAQSDADQLSVNLIEACKDGDLDAATELISRGANVSFEDWEQGLTPFRAAIQVGSPEIVELLLESGVEQHSEWQAWTLAMASGQVQVAALLKKRGFEAEPLPALVQVCHRGIISAAKELIPTVDSLDESATLYYYKDLIATPLTAACLAGNIELTQLLIEAGATVDKTDERGITPWVAAGSGGHSELCQILEASGANKDQQFAFILAADRCRLDILEQLLTDIEISNERVLDGQHVTAIAAAISGRYTLLDSDDQYQDKDQQIAEVVAYLLNQEASPNARVSDDELLIHKAVRESYPVVTRTLLENNADIEAKTEDGDSALLIAAKNSNTDMCSRLLYRGANPNIVDSQGVPAILVMFGEWMQCDAEMAKWFICYGVDLTATDSSQFTLEQRCEMTAEPSYEDEEDQDEHSIEQANEILEILRDKDRLKRMHGVLRKSPETPELLDEILNIAIEEFESESDPSMYYSVLRDFIDKNPDNCKSKLTELSSHQDWRYRHAAALNLDSNRLDDDQVTPLIIKLIADDDEDVRTATAVAISTRGSGVIDNVIKAYPSYPTGLLQALTSHLLGLDENLESKIVKSLEQMIPDDLTTLNGVERLHAGIGLGILGDFENRRHNSKKAIKHYADSVLLNPNLQIGFWSELAEACSQDGDSSLQNAIELYSNAYELDDPLQSRKLLEDGARLRPDFPWCLNNLAWDLATNSNEKLRDGDKAVSLALKLCEQDNWHYSSFLDTLAAAYAETGEFDLACSTIRKAIENASPEDVEEYEHNLTSYLSKKRWSAAD